MESDSDAGANAVSAPDIGALQTELVVQRGRYLHRSADFDNFCKRTARESSADAAAQKELHDGASSKRFPTIIQFCGIYIDSVPGRKPIPQR
jgi:hypothetical protein